ncbi:hypothetical protein GCM10022256_22650 [Frondihabitans peucedani]|uniref:Uncharacterized protein n=1 Tax=Frondihabitans peucedani TaxID=598626 RepID=A0ABP8E362_9MICO
MDRFTPICRNRATGHGLAPGPYARATVILVLGPKRGMDVVGVRWSGVAAEVRGVEAVIRHS